MTHNRIAALLVAATFAVVTACAGDSSTGPGGGKPAGAYALRQVDGGAIPAKIYHGPYFDEGIRHFYNQLIAEVTAGVIELDGDGRYYMELSYRFTGDGEVSVESFGGEGDYEVQDGGIHFQSDQGPQFSATLQKGTIELSIPNYLKKERPLLSYSFRR